MNITLHKTLVILLLPYVYEMWKINKKDHQDMGIFTNKMAREGDKQGHTGSIKNEITERKIIQAVEIYLSYS